MITKGLIKEAVLQLESQRAKLLRTYGEYADVYDDKLCSKILDAIDAQLEHVATVQRNMVLA